MQQSLVLSRAKIAAYLDCPRRFQLRYLERLPWPVAPGDEPAEEARQRGEQFHRLLQRYFLGLPVSDEVAADSHLNRWWSVFQKQGPQLPAGRPYPELTLTIPLGRHLLTGRFDLLILAADQVHVFDWKTEARPRSEADLRQDLQTRLYLALLVQGGSALGREITADQVKLTYWYVNQPDAAVTFTYTAAWHQANWTSLERLAGDIDALLEGEQWALTADLNQCDRCAYQVYCGRQTTTPDLADWEPEDDWLALEPEIP
jgi:RecB family exonuclease